MKHYFINLTNGIECLPQLKNVNGGIHFMRIRSTTIERKDWLFLLMDLDHNFLLHLAMGKEVIFVDYGTNRKLSKTIYKALPLIEYCLNKFWLEKETKAYRRFRHSDEKVFDQDEHYKHIYDELFTFNSTSVKNKLKTKLKYFKRFLNTTSIKIDYIAESTSNDGNYELYSKILKENY